MTSYGITASHPSRTETWRNWATQSFPSFSLVQATTTLKVGGMCLKPFLNVRLKKKKTARSVEPGRTPCTHRSAVSRLDLKENERPAKKIIGKISGLTRVSGLQLQTHLLRPLRPPWFFFNLPGSRASLTANHKRWSQICCETSWSFSGNTSNKTKICCRK